MFRSNNDPEHKLDLALSRLDQVASAVQDLRTSVARLEATVAGIDQRTYRLWQDLPTKFGKSAA